MFKRVSRQFRKIKPKLDCVEFFFGTKLFIIKNVRANDIYFASSFDATIKLQKKKKVFAFSVFLLIWQNSKYEMDKQNVERMSK